MLNFMKGLLIALALAIVCNSLYGCLAVGVYNMVTKDLQCDAIRQDRAKGNYDTAPRDACPSKGVTQ